MSERADQWGIQTEYQDAFDKPRSADPEAVARVMEILSQDGARPRGMLPQTCVVRDRRSRQVQVDAPEQQQLAWSVSSDGTLVSGSATSPFIDLPLELAVGSYRLHASIKSPNNDGPSDEATLLLAPERAYQGSERTPWRFWAIAVQLYGVRSRRNWGHGDFSDLADLVDLAADLGAAGIALNPLHALFDPQAETSPYAPSSRQFLNTRYIDVEAIPEFPGLQAAGMQQTVEALRQGDMIDYPGVVAAKQQGLRLAYDAFRQGASESRRREFDRFRRQRGSTLAQFACFERLRSRFPQPWWEWPAEWQRPQEDVLARRRGTDHDSIAFHEFAQWIADQQLGRCRDKAAERGLPIGLYLDLAVGVRADGFDAWSAQDTVLRSVEVGAPPDILNTAGQKWGLAGVNPVALERHAFQQFREVLRASMRYAGAIRLDHVLALQRLYLVPAGMSADKGVYVRFPFHALLAVIAQESVAHRCLVIGEDLGTVPENFRETLADWGFWSYQVMLFERAWDGAFRAPEHYRENALATFATHDLPTFAGWRTSRDLAVKRELGIDPGETDDERNAAQAALRHALSARGMETVDVLSVTKYLAAASSRLLIVSLEDAVGVAEQVNLPGTVDEHPNWRRRLPVDVADLKRDSTLPDMAQIMRDAGRSNRR
jgi:4-alpha-glucanotransferase